MQFDFEKKFSKKRRIEFADYMQEISDEIGFKVSARGWCYILEQKRIINKDQFDKVSTAINKCIKEGVLPVDFVAREDARMFHGVEVPDEDSVYEAFASYTRGARSTPNHYGLDWWEDEDVYIQVVVEKVDLVTLFEPVCAKFHIPIANSKGWSSVYQRAEYARRFDEAEKRGMRCVLLYCGDHDPDGLRISDTLRKNIEDVADVQWSDGSVGYDPEDLEIERFGLNYNLIQSNGLTWIDNLLTGRGLDLADPSHKNHNLPYLQNYLSSFGAKKCEANAIVVIPEVARDLMQATIESYLGYNALSKFQSKREEVKDEFKQFMQSTGVDIAMDKVIDVAMNYDPDNHDPNDPGSNIEILN